jgi:hypothetical protein
MKIIAFSNVTPCSLADVYRYLEERTAYILRVEDCVFFYPEDEGSKFLRNVGNYLPDYTVSHPKIVLIFGGVKT